MICHLNKKSNFQVTLLNTCKTDGASTVILTTLLCIPFKMDERTFQKLAVPAHVLKHKCREGAKIQGQARLS